MTYDSILAIVSWSSTANTFERAGKIGRIGLKHPLISANRKDLRERTMLLNISYKGRNNFTHPLPIHSRQ